MKINYSAGKLGMVTLLLIVLTGCTTYVVQQPEPQAYTPPPPPPDPVVLQPAPPPAPEPPPAPAPTVVVIQSDDDFYQPLSPYGQWVDVDGYGRCWQPAQVDPTWRPYANGHWELTDDGWYWDSDEPWAWATYHYGRWESVGGRGWFWVPQTEWAPAWVSWREGGGYVGWAPMPPERRGGVSINVNIAPASFCFVDERRMHEPVRPTTVIVNNTTIINKTVNITKTKVVNKVVINEGPRSDEVERVSGHKLQAVSATELRHKEEQPVAEKNRNLHTVGNHGQQPQPQPVNRPPQTRNQDQHPGPAVPIPQNEMEKNKPVHPEPVRTKPAPPQPSRAVDQKPPTTIPPHPAQGGGDNNHEPPVNHPQPIHEQNPPPVPAPHEVRPVERSTGQNPSVDNSRQHQPTKPQPVQPAPKPDRAVKSPKQKDQSAPKNNQNRNREADGTNVDQGGRR
ncbi:MAG TPA: DUF6600 domain-containing protein [Verrucomicrobiae bacterium]|jgi:hypothetical protein|nr:DUF6600 domain-containing protein [Verrucomicrobiae bacterium]